MSLPFTHGPSVTWPYLCRSARWRRPATYCCWGRNWVMQIQLPPPNPWVSCCRPAWARGPCPLPHPSPHRSPAPPLKVPSPPARAAATTQPTSRAWSIVRRSWPQRWEWRTRWWWLTLSNPVVTRPGSLLWTDHSHLCSVVVPAPPDAHLQQWIQPGGQQHQWLQGEQWPSTVAVVLLLLCPKALMKNAELITGMCSGVCSASLPYLPQVWWKSGRACHMDKHIFVGGYRRSCYAAVWY